MINVPIIEKSKKSIQETFNRYKKIQGDSRVIYEKAVLHIYPTEDTDDGVVLMVIIDQPFPIRIMSNKCLVINHEEK